MNNCSKHTILDLYIKVINFESKCIVDYETISTIESDDCNTDLVKKIKQAEHDYNEKISSDEIFAEYLHGFLIENESDLELSEAITILRNIFWVFRTYSSTYILSMCDYLYLNKVKENHLRIIGENGRDLLQNLPPNSSQYKYWKEFVVAIESSQSGAHN